MTLTRHSQQAPRSLEDSGQGPDPAPRLRQPWQHQDVRTTSTPEPAPSKSRRLLPALLKSVLVCAAVCANSVLGSESDRGGTSHDMFTTSIPCASRCDNYYSQSRAFNHGSNRLEHEKRQVRFADDPGRSDRLTAERNLEDYSRCATCSVQCDNESHLPCVQCGAGAFVGCLVSNACPACFHA